MTYNSQYSATVISATTTIKTGQGSLGGIFVSAASSTPTITIYDNTSAAGTQIASVFTPTAGTFYAIPASFGTGLHVVISGTVSATILWV